MKSNPTIKDIAQAANVSAGAVSLALNDRPGVSDKTRRKIQKIARKMDYRPNYAAKQLIGQPSHTIGLILRNIADPFFPELALGVEEKATERGYSLLLCNTNGTLEKEKQALDALRAKGVDGVILSTVTVDDPNIQALIDADIPFVCVNRFVMDPSIESKTDYVVLDNYACGYEGMRHLLRMGFKRIAVLTGDLNTSTAAMRRQGEQDALAAFHVVQDAKLVPGHLAGLDHSRQCFGPYRRSIDFAPSYGQDNLVLGEAGKAQLAEIRERIDIVILEFPPGHLETAKGIGTDRHEGFVFEVGQAANIRSVRARDDHRTEADTGLAALPGLHRGDTRNAVAGFQIDIVAGVGEGELDVAEFDGARHLVKIDRYDFEAMRADTIR